MSYNTEIIELPSRGLLYPKGSPLASGTIELKYLTAAEEDILTNRNYISNGSVIDRLFKALVVTPGVEISDLLVGDINALLFAIRILSYDIEYEFRHKHPTTGKDTTAKVNLNDVSLKYLDDEKSVSPGVNEFEYTLPKSKKVITFKLPTRGDMDAIDSEDKFYQKQFDGKSYKHNLTLIHTILSIDGSRDQKTIRQFVDKELLAMDSSKLKIYMSAISPDVNTVVPVMYADGHVEEGEVPITETFFWPGML